MAGPHPRLVGAAALVFVDDPAVPVPTTEDVHHLVGVLRLRPGEPVVAADGRGRWVPCRMAPGVDGGRARDLDPAGVLVPAGPPVTEAAPSPPLTVAFAPVKGDRPEWAVQKLTELGVDRIVALVAGRSVVRWDGERAARALGRWQRVAREAAAQCRRPRLPEVVGPLSLSELVAAAPDVVLARPDGPPPTAGASAVAVGPEGGWTREETELVPAGMGLGTTVLRTETAAVAAATVLAALRSGVVTPCVTTLREQNYTQRQGPSAQPT